MSYYVYEVDTMFGMEISEEKKCHTLPGAKFHASKLNTRMRWNGLNHICEFKVLEGKKGESFKEAYKRVKGRSVDSENKFIL